MRPNQQPGMSLCAQPCFVPTPPCTPGVSYRRFYLYDTFPATLYGTLSALMGGGAQTFAATDLEVLEPKSDSESESEIKALCCLLTTFRPLVSIGFLSPTAPASESRDPSFAAVLVDLGAAFFLVRISTMDGWLSETERCV